MASATYHDNGDPNSPYLVKVTAEKTGARFDFNILAEPVNLSLTPEICLELVELIRTGEPFQVALDSLSRLKLDLCISHFRDVVSVGYKDGLRTTYVIIPIAAGVEMADMISREVSCEQAETPAFGL